jgi:hypothetical protein
LNSGGGGSIYYTLDGTDPRRIGGSQGTSALDGGDDKQIAVSSNTVLKARIRNGSEWSALHELMIVTGREPGGLALTEIHYNPLGGGEYEFLELKNRSGLTLSLSGARLVRGVDYAFPDGTSIPPGAFYVIASNVALFRSRYGFPPSGEYTGQLDNAGERLALVGASGDTLLSARYNDKAPWPEAPDSTGQSLVPRNPQAYGDPNAPEYWTASSNVHGSPAADDASTAVEQPTHALPFGFTLEQNYPNPFNSSTRIHFTVARASEIRLAVYDVMGREAARLAEGIFQAGSYTVHWNAESSPAGVYVCRLESEGIRAVRKMVLMK